MLPNAVERSSLLDLSLGVDSVVGATYFVVDVTKCHGEIKFT